MNHDHEDHEPDSKRLRLTDTSQSAADGTHPDNTFSQYVGMGARAFKAEHPGVTREPYYPPNLDLHNTWPQQSGVLQTRFEPFNPVNSIQDAKFVQFKLSTTQNDLILPSRCRIHLDLQIVKADGTPADQGTAIPVNGIGSALFKNVIVRLNGKQIEPGDGLYAYRGDFEKRLNNDITKQKYGMSLAMYTFPEASFDEFAIGRKNNIWNRYKPWVQVNVDGLEPGAGITATGSLKYPKYPTTKPLPKMIGVAIENRNELHPVFADRLCYCDGGQLFQVIDVIHSNIFNQGKHLPPNSTLEVQFDLQDDPQFYLLKQDKDDNERYRIKIRGFGMWVKIDTCELDFIADMAGYTERQEKLYRLPAIRTDMNYLVRTKDVNDLSETAAFLKDKSRIPRKIIIGLVKQDAFHGSYSLDPFHYDDVKANSVALRVGGQMRPLMELRADRGLNENTQTQDISQFLWSLEVACGCFMTEKSIGINRCNYRWGNFMLGFDLGCGDQTEKYFEFPDRKNIELYYHLAKALEHAYSMVIYAEYDIEYQIDHMNRVVVTQ